ncbi:MAG: hypothetical protein M5U29_12815 [Anaerolineae bacterium]|nr:hypothetical protein [Anaerolineae bacterium]
MPDPFQFDRRLLPALPGTYALILRLDRPLVLVAGRLAPQRCLLACSSTQAARAAPAGCAGG